MKNEMIKTNSIWYKIKKFFKELFGKKESKENVDNTQDSLGDNSKSDFLNSITIKKDEERERIIKLQQQLRNNEIKEEDLSDEDIQNISDLYDEQIAKMEQEIENNKMILERYRKKLSEN